MVLPGIGFACGVAATAIVLGSGVAPVGHAEAQAAAPAAAAVPEALIARIGQLESALGRMEAAAAERSDTLARRIDRAEAFRSPQGERFIAAALVLQASVATARPWLREYQAMARLAPPGMLPAPLSEVLLSHAARGLPTEAELRERYIALVPQLVARVPRQGDMVQQAVTTMRGAVASIGLVAAPAPSDQEQAIEGVVQHLRRGNLAAAVGDAAALDPSLQPLLAGWLAQAGARLAVEQAVQETLLRMLAAPPRG
ncbi:hypothetical protein [Neoroseomonas rubea]|uniref:hypothetical protein n=1 Tax=Neoroseomonas rubea TaxID=2748666 RepID=UPI0018DFB747|nr:hypothetical protein [Roseomonas rubea]